MTAKEARSRLDLVSALVVGAFGIFTLILGSWAIVDTTSFYDNIATFPPYNRHFLHDIGAFQIGLGTALALGSGAVTPSLPRSAEAQQERSPTGSCTSPTRSSAAAPATLTR